MKGLSKIPFLSLFLITIINAANAQDWPNLKRYQIDNQQLKDSIITAVYMGDSITDFWIGSSPDFFTQNHYIDRGISGQTSPQMLLRFRQDVLALRPKAVVILCGTNDIAGNTGPSTLQMTEDNIMSMAEIAKANKIKVILCSVLPAKHFRWSPDVQPGEAIIQLNAWIKGYAKTKRLSYIDYYSAMVDDENGLNKDYSADGVHPNKTGYAVMENLVKAALNQIL